MPLWVKEMSFGSRKTARSQSAAGRSGSSLQGKPDSSLLIDQVAQQSDGWGEGINCALAETRVILDDKPRWKTSPGTKVLDAYANGSSRRSNSGDGLKVSSMDPWKFSFASAMSRSMLGIQSGRTVRLFSKCSLAERGDVYRGFQLRRSGGLDEILRLPEDAKSDRPHPWLEVGPEVELQT